MKELSQKPDYETMWKVECELNKKLQEQNKELLELLKEADSVIDDYLNWRDEKRMDYFDIRARKLREALAKVDK